MIFTIGFTRKTARQFFTLLRESRVEVLLDIRISNTSQLAGFAKDPDLAWFLDQLCGIRYLHDTLLAPSEQLLKDYRAKTVTWEAYETVFDRLMEERHIEAYLAETYADLREKNFCLLCSEPTPEHCHRRLVAERFARVFGQPVVHL